MSRRSLFGAVLFLALLGGCRGASSSRIALVGATVIDGTGGAPLTDQVILIDGTQIEEIGPAAGFEFPKGTTRIDVSGKWIIPGLIDAHVHTSRWQLPRFLASGVTTVRDAHGDKDSILALRREAEALDFPGPRIFAVGAMLDAPPTTYPNALPVPDGDSARRAVDQLALDGADQFKVYTRITPITLAAVVDEANAFGLGVAAHLGLTDALTASRLGVRSIEHATGVPEATLSDPASLYEAHRKGFFAGWTAFEQSWASLDSARLTNVARELAGQGVTIVPTLILHEIYSRLDDSAVYHRPGLSTVPAAEQARWNVPGMISRAGWTPKDYERFRASRPKIDLFLRAFVGAGGRIATGTDASNQLLVPGYSIHEEMELLVKAGLTPQQALMAATVNGAELLAADSLGRVTPGRVADLVILDKDPLADIRNTRTVDRVVIRGRMLSADSVRKAW